MAATDNIKEIQRLFRACTADKEYVWKISDINKVTPEKSFSERNKFLSLYQKKMEVLAGDVLDLCKDIIDEDKDLMYEEYINVASSIESNEEDWSGLFQVFTDFYHDMKMFERQERDGICKYYYEEADPILRLIVNSNLIFERTVKGKTEKKTLDSNNEDNDCVFFYVNAKDSPYYKLCSCLSEYVYNKGGNEALNRESLECLALMVCLYIALKNENAKLYRQNRYFPKTETKATEAEEDAKEAEFPTELDTPEGRALLQKVIKAGFCDENYVWDETKWHEGEDVLALVCFVYMANNELGLMRKKGRKEIISWKSFDTLFTYRTKLNNESGKTQLQITMTNYKQAKKLSVFVVPKKIERKLAPLFDKH